MRLTHGYFQSNSKLLREIHSIPALVFQQLRNTYVVARINEKAKKVTRNEICSDMQCKKDDWIMYMHGYAFHPSKMSARGD